MLSINKAYILQKKILAFFNEECNSSFFLKHGTQITIKCEAKNNLLKIVNYSNGRECYAYESDIQKNTTINLAETLVVGTIYESINPIHNYDAKGITRPNIKAGQLLKIDRVVSISEVCIQLSQSDYRYVQKKSLISNIELYQNISKESTIKIDKLMCQNINDGCIIKNINKSYKFLNYKVTKDIQCQESNTKICKHLTINASLIFPVNEKLISVFHISFPGGRRIVFKNDFYNSVEII